MAVQEILEVCNEPAKGDMVAGGFSFLGHFPTLVRGQAGLSVHKDSHQLHLDMCTVADQIDAGAIWGRIGSLSVLREELDRKSSRRRRRM